MEVCIDCPDKLRKINFVISLLRNYIIKTRKIELKVWTPLSLLSIYHTLYSSDYTGQTFFFQVESLDNITVDLDSVTTCAMYIKASIDIIICRCTRCVHFM